MRHFCAIRQISALLAVFYLLASPASALGSSVTFAPGSCPSQTDLSTHLTTEIDARVAGLAANDATKKIFTTQDFATQTYVRNAGVWTNNGTTSIDLTGISPWNATGSYTRAGVLISPRHIAFADHYPISVGATIVFVASDNTVVTRTLSNEMRISGTDAMIGVLDSDVPGSITHYPIISAGDIESHMRTVQVPMLVLDQEEKALVRDISMINNGSLGLGESVYHVAPPATTTRALFSEGLGGGDSGNPAFVIIGGKPVLMLTHYGPGIGPSYSYLLDRVNSAMASLGGGYEASSYDLSCFNTGPVVSGLTSFAVEERSSLGTAVGTVTATDDGSSLSFSILSGNDGNVFAINGSGQITVASSTGLNYQAKSLYSLAIGVTDDAVIPFSTSTAVTVNITNFGDIPTIISPGLSVPENVSTRTLVGTIAYSSEATSSLSFTLLSGDSSFSLGTSTGAVYLEAGHPLNREVTSSYPLVIRITDSFGSSTATVNVSVADANDAPSITTTSLSVADSAALGTVAGTIGVMDEDASQQLIYTIVGGNVLDAFSLDIYTGVLTVNNPAALDWSSRQSISLVVRVQDTGSPSYSDTGIVLVTIGAKAISSSGGGGGSGGGSSGGSSSVTTASPIVTTSATVTNPTSLAVVTPVRTTLSPAVSSPFSRNLSAGASGPDVLALQGLLAERGYLVPTGVTGEFGPLTRAALATYQAASGISPAVGYFGPVTRLAVALNPVSALVTAVVPSTQAPVQISRLSLSKYLRVGSTDSETILLQKELNARGFVIAPAGPGSIGNETPYFGPLTAQAVARFQAAKGIEATGTVGPLTRAALNESVSRAH